MTVKEIEALEGYYKTENEHWNTYAFTLLCEAMKMGVFEELEQPLRIFSKAIDVYMKHPETSLKAADIITTLIEKETLILPAKLFVYEWIIKYFVASEFDNCDTTEIVQILLSQKARLLQEQPDDNKLYTMDIRESLKGIVNEELAGLRDRLEKLEPSERLQIVCKLIPYIVPKSQSIHPTYNERKE